MMPPDDLRGDSEVAMGAALPRFDPSPVYAELVKAAPMATSLSPRRSSGGIIFTATVCGSKPVSAKVAMKSAAGTARAQGVLQVCPPEVFTSAPAGSDSNCRGTVGVAVFNISPDDEHAASANPHAAIASNLCIGKFRPFTRGACRSHPA
jgi:hypothetical protein